MHRLQQRVRELEAALARLREQHDALAAGVSRDPAGRAGGRGSAGGLSQL
jgi:hypothetical protein